MLCTPPRLLLLILILLLLLLLLLLLILILILILIGRNHTPNPNDRVPSRRDGTRKPCSIASYGPPHVLCGDTKRPGHPLPRRARRIPATPECLFYRAGDLIALRQLAHAPLLDAP